MASRVWLTPGYIIPRWSLWTLLLVIAVLDGIFHRRVRSRGYQLYAALVRAWDGLAASRSWEGSRGWNSGP